MKIKITPLLLLACCLVSGTAFSQSVPLRTIEDSVSYSLAIDMGLHLKRLDVPMNQEAFAAGINDALIDHPEMLSREEAYAILQEYFTVQVPAMKKQQSEEFLASVMRENRKVKRTESGLLYEIIKPGDKKQMAVNADDKVLVHYEGRLRSGEVFDSSYERGESMTLGLDHVIAGWSEGIKLIGKGGKIRLWIPSELAYGEQGASAMIGPYEAIVFDVELLDVNPEEE